MSGGPRWRRALGAVGAVLWAATIALASATPDPPGADVVPEIPYLDKVVHLGLFAVLGALLRLAGLRPGVAWLLAATWGLLDELHQSTVPGRDADPFDLLADAAGAYLGILAVGWSARRRGGPG